jgi:phosphoribosylanthranilate isomerase
MTSVKICGITNLDDARCALDAGADMLGFIFYPRSPRYIQPDTARVLVNAVKAWRHEIITVGVFVNEPPTHVLETLEAAGLDLAQLSGDEPVADVQVLGERAYKAIRDANAALKIAALPRRLPSAVGPDLLLDADHPTLYGGSGVRADESLAATLARQRRLMLAGGLTPDNVAQAIHVAQPWGVDVASGVEAVPGRKDHDKVRAFIKAVRESQ